MLFLFFFNVFNVFLMFFLIPWKYQKLGEAKFLSGCWKASYKPTSWNYGSIPDWPEPKYQLERHRFSRKPLWKSYGKHRVLNKPIIYGGLGRLAVFSTVEPGHVYITCHVAFIYYIYMYIYIYIYYISLIIIWCCWCFRPPGPKRSDALVCQEVLVPVSDGMLTFDTGNLMKEGSTCENKRRHVKTFIRLFTVHIGILLIQKN